jgi:putative ABC transport system permease protein
MTTPEMTVVTSNHLEETVIIDGQGLFLVILGVGDNYFDVYQYKFLHGRPINRQEITDAIPVAVLDKNTANLYFGKNDNPIGKNFELNGIQYKVVGIVENSSIFTSNMVGLPPNVIVPLEAVKVFKQSVKRIISFTAKDKASYADMQAEFFRLLNETNLTEEDQLVFEDRRSLEKQNQIMPGVGLLLFCLILMLIPALNILSLNVSKSFDRSEEIAIRKAFGAPIRTIFGQLFFENLLLTLAGSIIGMCVTPLLLNGIDKLILSVSILPTSFAMQFDWKTILLIAGPCVLVFSFLSGSIPAWITAKREIVNVLKGEAQ